MPIRFCCPFCDQVLSISGRKVGASIICPRCRGEVGVPGPAPPPPPPLVVVSPDPVLTVWEVCIVGVTLLGMMLASFLAGLALGAVL